MKLFNILAATLILPSALASFIVPRDRNTPNFYLVAVSSDPQYNLKPLRVNTSTFAASLTTGDATVAYIDGGISIRLDSPNNPLSFGSISGSLTSTGCNPDGQLYFLIGGSSNKCARANPFAIQSYDQNAQLGAKLAFNWTGGFYACDGGATVYYYTGAPTKSGCSAITLWTVPKV